MKSNKLFYFGVTILCVLASLGFYEYSILDRANNQAESFRHTLSRREYLLKRVEHSIGYNGAIHHFKNYILRGTPKEDKYYHRAQKSILEGLEAIDNLSYEFKEYQEFTPDIRRVFLAYLANLDQAKDLILTGKRAIELDRIIRVDDSPAIKAIEGIEEKFRVQKQVFRASHEKNIKTLKKTFIIAFTTATILFALLLFAFNHTLSSVVSEKLKLSENKDSFVRKMAHEIRTPLNAILGFQEFLHTEEMNPSDRENLKHIKESSLYLLTLINDILDFSKLKEKKLKLQDEPIKETHFWNMIKMIGLGLKKPDQLFEVITPKNLSWICADEVRLKQIVLNLLSNAIKFTPEEGKVSLHLEFFEKANSNFMKITLSDTGVGMSQQQLNHIFDPYYQVDGQKDSHKGTGLGLNITHTLVELMGGKIDVTSQKGKGTSFVVILPRVFVPADQVTELEESEKQAPLNNDFDHKGLKDQKVLVVEDNPINQKLMKKYYAKLGLPTPLIAEDGIKALAMVEEHRPDLIFMDLLMPHLDGIETTIRIRKEFSYKPIIIGLSANTESKEECLKVGMDDFLSKPLQKKSLKEMLYKYRTSAHKKSA